MRNFLLLASVLFACHPLAHAQLRHDANWCFGDSAGIYFGAVGNPTIFNSQSSVTETASCISSASGQLLFVLNLHYNQLTDYGVLLGTLGTRLDNGDSLLMGSSITQGALFLPGSDSATYYFYHLGYDPALSVQGLYSIGLYRTTIARVAPGHWAATRKNELMIQGPLQEKLAAVRAADGSCWWVLTHRETFASCSNEFRLLKVCGGTIVEDKSQQVGKIKCGGSGYYGEMEFSPDGQMLAMALGIDSFEVFSFDRCVGELKLTSSIGSGYGGGAYGLAFSPNNSIIYVSEKRNNSDTSFVYQYSLSDSTLTVLRKEFDPGNFTGQLERGSNGKIYLSYCGKHCHGALTDHFEHCLSVINRPDSIGSACDFEQFGFCFTDSTVRLTFGLPNFPNYNLGPEGVFSADAGRDTVLCGNTNQTGVPIGAPPVPNVTYSWQPAFGLSATNVARPIANPAQSSWYYLTATDTTAASCAVHMDSVYVEVKICTGIRDIGGLQAKVYPNPTNGHLTIELPMMIRRHTLAVYNPLGQRVLEKVLPDSRSSLKLDLPPGFYIYQIIGDGIVQSGKLVVE